MSTVSPITPRTGLVIIDVQKGFDDPKRGKRNNPHAEKQIAVLLAAWREKGLPLFHVQHASNSPDGFFQEGEESFLHKEEAKPLPWEPVYKKSVNSAFIGTSLEADLRKQAIDKVVIVGLTTNHCVSTTARMSGNLGFDTYVVEDATATFDRTALDGKIRPASEVHASALSDLRDEFATIVKTADVLTAVGAMDRRPEANEERSETTTTVLSAREIPSPAAQAYIDRITGALNGREPFDVLRSTSEALDRLVSTVAADTLAYKPQLGKWSVAETVAHLADTETVLGFRLRQILSKSGIEIAGFDQDLWAAVGRYGSIPAAKSLERFRVNRDANLDILSNLTALQMEMYGIHAERGRETVAHLCRMWAGHDLNHLAQISALIASH